MKAIEPQTIGNAANSKRLLFPEIFKKRKINAALKSIEKVTPYSPTREYFLFDTNSRIKAETWAEMITCRATTQTIVEMFVDEAMKYTGTIRIKMMIWMMKVW